MVLNNLRREFENELSPAVSRDNESVWSKPENYVANEMKRCGLIQKRGKDGVYDTKIKQNARLY